MQQWCKFRFGARDSLLTRYGLMTEFHVTASKIPGVYTTISHRCLYAAGTNSGRRAFSLSFPGAGCLTRSQGRLWPCPCAPPSPETAGPTSQKQSHFCSCSHGEKAEHREQVFSVCFFLIYTQNVSGKLCQGF